MADSFFREKTVIFSLDMDAWQRRVSAVRLPANAVTARLCPELIDGAGEVWFDDVSLIPGRVEDPTFQRKPTARIRVSPACVRLGEWIEANASGSTAARGRRVCGFERRVPARARRPFSLGWPLKWEEGARPVFRPLHTGKFSISLGVFDSLPLPYGEVALPVPSCQTPRPIREHEVRVVRHVSRPLQEGFAPDSRDIGERTVFPQCGQQAFPALGFPHRGRRR